MTRKPVFAAVKARFGSRYPYAVAVAGVISLRLLSLFPSGLTARLFRFGWVVARSRRRSR